MRRRVLTFVAALFTMNLLCVAVLGQQTRTYPAYTIETRQTEYDAKGEQVGVSTTAQYHSATGDWRAVTKSGDIELATIYRRGIGVYQSSSRTNRSIKQTSHAPGCPLRTADQLSADPRFQRLEQVLNFTAYVLVDHVDKQLVSELYYVPELGGGTPVKTKTTHKNGARFETEPISITLGEPDETNIIGPDYLVIEQEPAWTKNLEEQILSKPDPEFPADAIARRVSGFVNVMVIVDHNGQVLLAAARPGSGPSPLREAAVEAAYKATFKPIICNDAPVVAAGFISYGFVLPK